MVRHSSEASGLQARLATWIGLPRGSSAEYLVRTLREARDERQVGGLTRRLDRLELLIVDEVGFLPFDRAGGELLFNLLAGRHSRRSVMVTTNLAFSEWPSVFGGDEKLTTALLDRLGERATVLTTKGKSFRMRRRAATSQRPRRSLRRRGRLIH